MSRTRRRLLRVLPANCKPQTRMLSDVRNKHILDTSAWNALLDDPEQEEIERRRISAAALLSFDRV